MLGGTLACGGCGGSEACVAFDDEVLLTALITDNGERARVEVELRRADLGQESIPVKLCEGNSLVIDDVATTEVQRLNGATIHEAMLPAVGEAGVLMHRLELRSGGETSEFVATVDAPGFTITAPSAEAEVSRAASLAIAWTPARGEGSKISIKVADAIDGDACLGEPIELEEPDDGEFTVAMAKVELNPDMPPDDGACEAFVTLSRAHSAPLELATGAAALHPDSRVEATTSRTVEFVSVP